MKKEKIIVSNLKLPEGRFRTFLTSPVELPSNALNKRLFIYYFISQNRFNHRLTSPTLKRIKSIRAPSENFLNLPEIQQNILKVGT